MKNQCVIAIHPMKILSNFYDFRLKWTATAAIGINPTKTWLSQLVDFKIQSDTLEERYAIKFCFQDGKNATETNGMLQTAFRPSCMNRASDFEWHKRFKEGRESVGDDESVRGVRKSIRLTWLAKGLGLLCWGFMEVQEEIASEEASTLQIGPVAFPPGQYTSPQLHPCHRLFEQDGHSRKAGSLWEMMRGVGGVRKSIDQTWLAKVLGLGLGLICWGFKGIQEEIPSEETSTLQIRSVAFPPGQCTSIQLQPCHRLFDQDSHQNSSLSIAQTLLQVFFIP